jgi:hypothetical protein
MGVLSSLCGALLVGCTSEDPQPESPAATRSLAANDVGFVLDVVGDWRLKGREGTAIHAGDSLPATGVVTRSSDAPSNRLLVVSFCTGAVKAYTEAPIQLPARVDDAQPNRFWTLASRRYHEDLVSVQSRDGEQSRLRDAVVRCAGDQLQLAPAFGGMPAGQYRLRLEPVRDLAPEGTADSIPLDAYDWSPSTEPVVAASTPLRGVYVLFALNDTAPSREESALIMVCSPVEFDQVAQDIAGAGRLIASWGNVASPEASRRFLQATMAGLAAESLPSSSTK